MKRGPGLSRIELPPKWTWTTLGELATSVKNGIYVSRPSAEPNGIPILRIGAVRPMHLSLDDLRYTGMSLAEVQRNDGLVRPGDLLFTRYSGNPRLVGACARVPDHSPIVAYPDKLIRVVLSAEEVDSRFISYAWISSKVQAQVRSRIKTTAGQTGISGSSLKSIRLPLPPLAEQRRIAQVLGHADAVRAKRRMAIALLDNLAHSVFLDMFGDPAHNTMHWPERNLGALFAEKPNYGTMVPASADGGKWLCLRVANIQGWNLDLRDRKYVDLDESSIKRHGVVKGDVLLTRAIATQEHLGKAIVADPDGEKWAFDSHLMRIRLDRNEIEPVFFRSLLRSAGGRRLFLAVTRRSSVQFNINTKEIAALRIPLPPIERQREFVSRLAVTGALCETYRSHLAELDALFSSLQHRAFRGELWDASAA